MKSRHQHGQDADGGSNALEGIARLSFQSFHDVVHDVAQWLYFISARRSSQAKRAKLEGGALLPVSSRPLFFQINHVAHFLALHVGFVAVFVAVHNKAREPLTNAQNEFAENHA